MKKQFFSFWFPEIVMVVLLVISGNCLVFSSGRFIINFKMIGFSVLSFMQKQTYSVSSHISGTFTALKDMKNLQDEYNALTEKLKDYEYLQRSNAEIRKENERLKEQLDFSDSIQYKNIAAQIIGRNIDSMFSGLTINKGIVHGVKKGMPVIAIQTGNIGVVGKIITVGHSTSIVMPLFDIQCNISSRLQNLRDLGITNGNGSDSIPLSLKYIKKRNFGNIHYGDVVVTSGENDNYMRDIPIGTITKITPIDYDSSLEIELEPIIDFSRLETVLVIDMSNLNKDVE